MGETGRPMASLGDIRLDHKVICQPFLTLGTSCKKCSSYTKFAIEKETKNSVSEITESSGLADQ